jgi:hypothetical protein
MTEQTRQCIELCLDCHRICLETVTHLQASGRPVGADAVRLLFNCAEACHLGAGLLRAGGAASGRAWGICADVCAESARYCEEFADNPRMRACAEACRRCAEACHEMAAIAA